MALPGPGENYWLPPEVASHDKDEPRPHVVLSPTEQNETVVTLAFGSTSNLQAARYGAPHVVVERTSPTFSVTGLRDTTFFYPSRLAVSLLTELPRRAAGRIIDEFPELRDQQLPRAVGLRAGRYGAAGLASSSRRGRIATFTDNFAELIDTRYGIVVTWPTYSCHDQVQNVVPIYDGEEFETIAPNFLVTAGEWLPQLSPIRSALVMVQLVQGAYDGGGLLSPEDKDIQGYLDVPADDAAMSRLEEALANRLFGARLQDVVP